MSDPSSVVVGSGGAPIDPTTIPGGKTPVGLLQECCSRRGVIPGYEAIPPPAGMVVLFVIFVVF